MRGKTYQGGREKSRSPDTRRRADALRDDERRRQASYVSSLGIKHKGENSFYDTHLKSRSLFDTGKKFLSYVTSSQNFFPYMTLPLALLHCSVKENPDGQKYPRLYPIDGTKETTPTEPKKCGGGGFSCAYMRARHVGGVRTP